MKKRERQTVRGTIGHFLTLINALIVFSPVQVVESKDDNYGHSDRRGIINKSTKLFTRKELREMLKKIKDESPEQPVPLLTTSSEGK